MSIRSIFLFLTVILATPAVGLSQENYPVPAGWDGMSEERKQEFIAIHEAYLAAKEELRVTPEEKAALSAAEKKAVNQARWELRSSYLADLEDAEFSFPPYSEMNAALEVKKQARTEEEESDTVVFDEEGLDSIVGSIVYDVGVVDTTFGGGAIIGNRFDTHTGAPVLASGTVSSVQAVVVQGPAFNSMNDSAGFVLLGPQTGMGGAFAIFSTFTNGLTGMTETVTFTGIGESYTGSSFFVLFGDFASSYVPAYGTGTTQGQGGHGVVGYTGGMGPNITNTFDFGGVRNGLVRATGNILSTVPVELMKFEIESKGAKKADEAKAPKAE